LYRADVRQLLLKLFLDQSRVSTAADAYLPNQRNPIKHKNI
jgi:hypothetical protein